MNTLCNNYVVISKPLIAYFWKFKMHWVTLILAVMYLPTARCAHIKWGSLHFVHCCF